MNDEVDNEDNKVATIAKFLEKFAIITEDEAKLVPRIPISNTTWVGFINDAYKLTVLLAKYDDAKPFVRGFNAGRNSILRQNVSGCCCIISENGDEVLEPCLLHKTWKCLGSKEVK